jgi:plastocyanin
VSGSSSVVFLAALLAAQAPNADLEREVAQLRADVAELKALVRALIAAEERKGEALKQALDSRPGPVDQEQGSSQPGGASPEGGSRPARMYGGGHDVRREPPGSATYVERAERPERPAKKKVGTIAGVIEGLRANAWVYVADIQGKAVARREATIEQKNKQFVPRFLVVQKGTRILFPNQDAIYHNVWSATPGNQFDLGTYRKNDSAKGHDFVSPGIVQVFCNIHSNMGATVVVVPNALFAKADAQGAFTLAGVPVGNHRIVAVAEGAEPVEKAVDVEADAEARVELTLKAKPFGPHLNKDGRPYAGY